MKKLLLCAVFLLSGCAQLMHGQEQPVVARNGVYFTTCAGAVEDWPSCYEKASRTCSGKYEIITKGDNSRGTQRDLTFQCKK